MGTKTSAEIQKDYRDRNAGINPELRFRVPLCVKEDFNNLVLSSNLDRKGVFMAMLEVYKVELKIKGDHNGK